MVHLFHENTIHVPTERRTATLTNMSVRAIAFLLASLYLMNASLHEDSWHLINGANLSIHEGGHVLASLFGEFAHMIGGSVLQILLPLIFAIYFLKRENKVAFYLMLVWAGQNVVNVGVYASDAVLMELPLVGGENALHDWHYILLSLHLLQYTPIIGTVIKVSGWLIMFTATALGVQEALVTKAREERTMV